MSGDFIGRAGRGLRIASPFLLTALLAFITVVPVPIPGFAAVSPALTLIAVYYWTIYRPDLMPPAAVFVIGVLQDVLVGTPLGLSSLVLLGVQFAVASQRRFFYGGAFVVEWCGFVIVAPGGLAFAWLLSSLYNAAWVPLRPLGFELVLMMAIYPLLTGLFGRLQRRLPRQA